MTQEEIIQAITDDKMMPFIQPEHLSEIVDFVIKNYKPSLPSNLDEAANNYGIDIRLGYPRVMDETDKYIYNAFKAGAEWMAGQGVEAKVLQAFTDGSAYIECPYEGRSGDKVVVQIRKAK